MKAIKITCILKKEIEKTTWVIGVKRHPEKEFEMINPSPSQIVNIKKNCDVKESKVDIDEEVEIEIVSEDNSELIQFATECWDLAVELREKIEELKTPTEPVPEKETEVIGAEKEEGTTDESSDEDVVAEPVKKPKATRTRKKKDK